MDDWRIIKEFEHEYHNLKLHEITFPDFWEKACIERNSFYQKLKEEAKQFVRDIATARGERKEYLNNRYNKLWHEHCDFCTDMITTGLSKCYCTSDFGFWFCEKCYNDFKEQFKFELVDYIGDDSGRIMIRKSIISK